MSISDILEDADSSQTNSEAATLDSNHEGDSSDGFDSSDSGDEENDGGFRWQIARDPNDIRSYQEFPFTGPQPGPTIHDESLIDIFTKLLGHDTLRYIVEASNGQSESSSADGPDVVDTSETNLTDADVWLYIAVVMLLEIHGKAVVKSNWSKDAFLHTPIFSQIMSYERFMFIHMKLKFAKDAHVTDAAKKVDAAWPIRPLFIRLNQQFQGCYELRKEVSVDESMLLWKGHSSLVRYIPTKSAKWGIKLYALAEAQTGYVHKLLIDQGAKTILTDFAEDADLQKPGKIVVNLMSHIVDRGHILAIDSYYSDCRLAELLHDRKTSVVGTISRTRRFLPSTMKETRWGRGQQQKFFIAYTPKFFCIKWKHRRDVRMLASIGSPAIEGRKPNVVNRYNKCMNGVDIADQMRHGREIARPRGRHLFRKIFLYLLDVTLVNAYIIAKHVDAHKRLTHQDFRLLLCKCIVYKYGTLRIPKRKVHEPILRLSERHTKIARAEKANDRRRCAVCQMKTPFSCIDCDVFMCPDECFHIYHTKTCFKK